MSVRITKYRAFCNMAMRTLYFLRDRSGLGSPGILAFSVPQCAKSSSICQEKFHPSVPTVLCIVFMKMLGGSSDIIILM